MVVAKKVLRDVNRPKSAKQRKPIGFGNLCPPVGKAKKIAWPTDVARFRITENSTESISIFFLFEINFLIDYI